MNEVKHASVVVTKTFKGYGTRRYATDLSSTDLIIKDIAWNTISYLLVIKHQWHDIYWFSFHIIHEETEQATFWKINKNFKFCTYKTHICPILLKLVNRCLTLRLLPLKLIWKYIT